MLPERVGPAIGMSNVSKQNAIAIALVIGVLQRSSCSGSCFFATMLEMLVSPVDDKPEEGEEEDSY